MNSLCYRIRGGGRYTGRVQAAGRPRHRQERAHSIIRWEKPVARMLWSDQDPVFDKANFWVCFSLIASGFEILKSQNPVSSLGRYSQMFGPNCILHNFHSWFSYLMWIGISFYISQIILRWKMYYKDLAKDFILQSAFFCRYWPDIRSVFFYTW